MNVPVVSLCFVLAYYACSVHSLPRMPLEMLTNDGGSLARATPEEGIASGMAPDESNKMVKRHRFREIVNDNLLTPDEIARIISSESNSDAHQESNKMVKKHRFREIVNDNLLTPDEIARIISSESISDAHQVPPSKRQEMDALMSRIQALLSDIRERQIKDTLQLPSLRFGR